MDMYGHCYSSMLVEAGYEMSQRISQGEEYDGRGRISQKQLDEFQHDDVHPFNDFTPEEKLDIALAMAEGIAVMHGHFEGVIVNDDGELRLAKDLKKLFAVAALLWLPFSVFSLNFIISLRFSDK